MCKRQVPIGTRTRSRSTSRCSQDAGPEQRAGEASPSYLCSHDAAARIAEVQPDARIIAILREPASFLRSLHLQLLRDHVETERDLRRAIALEARAQDGKEIPATSRGPRRCSTPSTCATSSSCAATTHAFGREQVLVLIYDDFRADNEATRAPGAALPRCRRRRRRSSRPRPIRRCACARCACTSSCARCTSGRGPRRARREGVRSRRSRRERLRRER